MNKHFFALLGLTLTFFAGAIIGQIVGFDPLSAGIVFAGISATKYVISLVVPHTIARGMAFDAIDLTELSAKLGDYERENRDVITSEMLLDEDFTEGMTVYDDVNDEIPLPNLSMTEIIQPGANKAFTPKADAIKIGARILKVRDVKVDLLFIPTVLEKTWLGFMKRNKQDPFELPFEKFIMDYINSKVKEDLRLRGIYKGIYNAAGTAAADTMTGFHKIITDGITAGDIDPIITGAITPANVIDKLELVYDGVGEAYKKGETEMKLAPTIFDWYVRSYRAVYGKNIDYKGMARDKVYLDGTSCVLVREPGKAGSQRVACTPANNLAYGVSSSKGYNMDVQKFDRQLKVLIDFKAGVELHQTVENALAVNDQL